MLKGKPPWRWLKPRGRVDRRSSGLLYALVCAYSLCYILAGALVVVGLIYWVGFSRFNTLTWLGLGASEQTAHRALACMLAIAVVWSLYFWITSIVTERRTSAHLEKRRQRSEKIARKLSWHQRELLGLEDDDEDRQR